MTIQRFFLPSETINSQTKLIRHSDPQWYKQLTKVLRLAPGDKLDILDGSGNLYHCTLESLNKGQVEARIDQSLVIKDDSLTCHIGLPLLRSGRFEWALEKLTELGIRKISPLVFERSVVKPALETEKNKLSRWQTILKEAAEQCERGTIPQLVAPLSFSQFLQSTQKSSPQSLKIICTERRDVPHLKNVLDNHIFSSEEVTMIIGCEGGLTTNELEKAFSADFIPVSLGQRVLRSETAAIYALSIVASCPIKKNSGTT